MARPKKRPAKRSNGAGTVMAAGAKFRWAITIATNPRRRLTGYCDTRAEAEIALAAAVTERERGNLAAPDKLTVAEYAERWLSRQQLRQRSRDEYAVELGYVNEVLGSERIQSITTGRLRDAMATMQARVMSTGQPMAPRTVGKCYTRLRSLFREAQEDGIIPSDVSRALRRPKLPPLESAGQVLTFEQVARLTALGNALWEIGLARLWPAVALAIGCGMRRSEIMGLRWIDVDLAARTLHIRHTAVTQAKGVTRSEANKTDSSRRQIGIPASVLAVLLGHQAAQQAERKAAAKNWQESGAVFTTEAGIWTYPDNLNRALDNLIAWSDPAAWPTRAKALPVAARAKLAAIIQAGEQLPSISPHDLRHTYATLALRKRVPVELVSKSLGHSRVSHTLDIYRHVMSDELAGGVVDLLGEG